MVEQKNNLFVSSYKIRFGFLQSYLFFLKKKRERLCLVLVKEVEEESNRGVFWDLTFFEMVFMSEILFTQEEKLEEGEWEKER